MNRHAIRSVRAIVASAALLVGCGEDFATGPQKFPGELDLANWSDTLVVGERRTVTARVLDAKGREVVGRSVQWTVGTPTIVSAASDAATAADGVLSVAGGKAVVILGVTPGSSVVTLEFNDAMFQEMSVERNVTVVAAGLQLELEEGAQVNLAAIGDSSVIVAKGLALDANGENVAVQGLGLVWTRHGPGAVELAARGDTAVAVAKHNGTDTLVVTHPTCAANAHCADTVLVSVSAGGSPPPPPPPPPPPLTISPTAVEKAVNQAQQFTAGGAAGPYIWSVEGVDGGNTTVGKVDEDGRYVAPEEVPGDGTVDVCVRRASGSTPACAAVTVTAAPSGGADVVVVNDINAWDAYSAELNDNFWGNIVSYPASGPRASKKSVMFYHGAGSGCLGNCHANHFNVAGLVGKLTSLEYTVFDYSGGLTSISADVKVIFLWMPTLTIGAAEVNALKQFASEGGRLVVVGENNTFYSGIAVENELLANLGSELVNQGDCDVSDAVAESSHQLVDGVNRIHVSCVSTMTPGPNDWIVGRSEGSGKVVIAVTRIDLTPLPLP